MQMAWSSAAEIGRMAGVCVLAGGLGGCYTLGAGGGGGGTTTTTTTTTPAKFSTFVGTVNAKGVNTQAIVNDYDPSVRVLTVETKEKASEVVAYVKAPDPTTKTQTVDLNAGGGYLRSESATIESNGAAVRGQVVSDANSWAVFTNTPGSRLDASLGAPSLESSFVGVAAFHKRAAGSTGAFYSYASGFFGGQSATNMPTSGKADYNGTFEGIEEYTINGSELSRRNISGKATLSADFAAKTVNGRIDDINNHSVGPFKAASDYSIAYDGKITNTDFSGGAWLTNKNSSAPRDGYTQNSGTLQGGFFGAGAAEAAGALGVSASDPARKYLITGAFGAKKK